MCASGERKREKERQGKRETGKEREREQELSYQASLPCLLRHSELKEKHLAVMVDQRFFHPLLCISDDGCVYIPISVSLRRIKNKKDALKHPGKTLHLLQ